MPLQTSKRRRFNHKINDYFFPNSIDAATASDSISPSGLLSPSLPADVQASLLQVGMRVRKTVAEGYQTSTKVSPSPQNTTSRGLTTPASAGLPISPTSALHDPISQENASSFTSSQDSTTTRTTSFLQVPPLPKKRRLSSSSMSPPLRRSASPPLRAMAQPKTRRRAPVFSAWGGCELGLKMEVDDFEDAEFLKPLEEEDPWGLWAGRM